MDEDAAPDGLRAEFERLRAIEAAARAAVDYYRLGYHPAATAMLELLDALGRALDG